MTVNPGARSFEQRIGGCGVGEGDPLEAAFEEPLPQHGRAERAADQLRAQADAEDWLATVVKPVDELEQRGEMRVAGVVPGVHRSPQHDQGIEPAVVVRKIDRLVRALAAMALMGQERRGPVAGCDYRLADLPGGGEPVVHDDQDRRPWAVFINRPKMVPARGFALYARHLQKALACPSLAVVTSGQSLTKSKSGTEDGCWRVVARNACFSA